MSNKILIGLPLYGSVGPRFFQKWLQFQAQVARANKSASPLITSNMAYVDHADTAIVTSALKDPDWDYILCVEHDNIVPDDFADVVANLDPEVHKIVGRWYFGRAQEDMRSICGYLHDDGRFDRLSYQQVKDFRDNPGLYRVGDGSPLVDQSARTFVVGMGCTAIHRSVFENWTADMPWFMSVSSWNDAEQKVGYLGHDVNFCMMAAEQGIDVWLDTRKAAGHVGEFVSDENTYLATAEHMARDGNADLQSSQELPAGIPTAMTKAELDGLAELAKGKVVLEVGSRFGASAIGMAGSGAQVVYAVDWHRGDVWHGEYDGSGDTLGIFWAYVQRYKLQDKIVPLVGTSQQVLPNLKDRTFDLIFLDGDHSHAGVKFDIEQALRLIKPDGIIAFHDYDRESLLGADYYDRPEQELGVTSAIEEAFGKPEILADTVAFVRMESVVAV